MKLKLKTFYSPLTNPYENLAVEDYLLKLIKPNEKYLLLYKNDPSIVFGRFQNPWVEANVDKALADKIYLVRRQSGGGTVYHDRENLNFCFINSTKDHQKDINNEILISALKSLGIDAYASGRSDLRVDIDEKPRKFSGSAFKQKKDVSFHHGTLLINSDLKILNEYLRSKLESIEAKGIKSVRSHVINLKELNDNITEDLLVQTCKNAFEKYYETTSELEEIQTYNQEYLEHLLSWKWVYGETPSFQAHLDEPSFELILKVNKGHIKEVEFSHSTLHPSLIEEIKDSLLELQIKKERISSFFEKFMGDYSEYKDEFSELKEKLIVYFGL